MKRPVLLIGGMDSSGGAGLARDLLAVHDAGQTARIAVTAVTAQTDHRVLAVDPVSPDMLAAQIDAALEDGIGAVKIGVLCNAALIRTVATRLPDVPVVLDPVLCSTSGHTLLEPEGIRALVDLLVPRIAVLTPNVPELAALKSVLQPETLSEDGDVVGMLLDRGCQSVLLKGGHDGHPELSTDILFQPGRPASSFRSARYPFDLRGTGCHLASSLAAALADGKALPDAVIYARHRVDERFRREMSSPVP
ncbi:hydroxymethylpyrimidine/phosphomethylpyrimidine kinase family protein [Gluconobacter aidae]|uniref:hydroxymethylpyrimidine kinase n=1 Tax=Gluconobacter aidae TaxID=2662454 RepID=A0A7X1SRX9_9PROT|nr:bifunctional hydroxymethylpyrimidine kinase/phosphomethylpyrimidine kinase [Gluconobacter aidae]MQS00097.1 hydroxymethylpyrimidine/phosphomethylpyrimidine kinase [Gluconobacter aidae]